MGKFLYAAFSIRLKKIYKDIDALVPAMLTNNTMLVDRVRLAKLGMKLATDSFGEGLKFGNFITGKNIKIDFPKRKIMEDYLANIKVAQDVYNLKNNHRKSKLKRDRLDKQRELIFGEYVNGIKRAIRGMVTNAGHLGQVMVVKHG